MPPQYRNVFLAARSSRSLWKLFSVTTACIRIQVLSLLATSSPSFDSKSSTAFRTALPGSRYLGRSPAPHNPTPYFFASPCFISKQSQVSVPKLNFTLQSYVKPECCGAHEQFARQQVPLPQEFQHQQVCVRKASVRQEHSRCLVFRPNALSPQRVFNKKVPAVHMLTQQEDCLSSHQRARMFHALIQQDCASCSRSQQKNPIVQPCAHQKDCLCQVPVRQKCPRRLVMNQRSSSAFVMECAMQDRGTQRSCGTVGTAKEPKKLSNPVIYIIGPTGVGKTKLAVQLCLSLQARYGIKAEIINADSMQVYRGCDVGTAKPTAEEQRLVPHHLLDICDVSADDFSVVKYLQLALQTIERLHATGTVPVVVGGTQLYMQHLLWPSALDLYLQPALVGEGTGSLSSAAPAAFNALTPQGSPAQMTENQQSLRATEGAVNALLREEAEDLEALPTEVLHARLSVVDPQRAMELHPRDRRRIIRSLETFAACGERQSALMRRYREESARRGLRYPSCVLWVDCRDENEHLQRLRDRAEAMIQTGLLQECEFLLRTLRLDESLSPTSPADNAASAAVAARGSADAVASTTAMAAAAAAAPVAPPASAAPKLCMATASEALAAADVASAAAAAAEATAVIDVARGMSSNTRNSRSTSRAAPRHRRLPSIIQSIGYKEYLVLVQHARTLGVPICLPVGTTTSVPASSSPAAAAETGASFSWCPAAGGCGAAAESTAALNAAAAVAPAAAKRAGRTRDHGPRRGRGEGGGGVALDACTCSTVPGTTPCRPCLTVSMQSLVTRTRVYARKQRRWIVNKFLLRQQCLPIYLLDTSGAAVSPQWEKQVHDPALQIVYDFYFSAPFDEGHPLAAARHLSPADEARRKFYRQQQQQEQQRKLKESQNSGEEKRHQEQHPVRNIVEGNATASSAHINQMNNGAVATTAALGQGIDPWVDAGLNKARECSICQHVCHGISDWEDHLQSKMHKARLQKERLSSETQRHFEQQKAKQTPLFGRN